MIGELLDDTYRVLERLGAGAMGEVYLVENVQIGRREAIKVLRRELADDPKLASRFRREARAINGLRHPNIIGIHAFGQLPDGRLYLTMEYLGGEPLDATLRRDGPFDVPRTLHVLQQLAAAIDHAHSHGVVHRDLKPTNLVLVTERGRHAVLKVLDFGLAKVMRQDQTGPLDSSTMQGELAGTAEYMAPERLEGHSDDPRSDLYSIGCIAHELLTGAPPFVGKPVAVIAQHLQSPPPAPSLRVRGIPAVLDALVQQLLAKDPARRPQSGKQLGAALEQLPSSRKTAAWRTGAVLATLPPADDEGSNTLPDGSRVPRQIAYADTAAGYAEELRDEVFNALVELAQAAQDGSEGDDDLTLALARVHGLRDDRARIIGERTELEERQSRAIQTVREREGSLRFAIGELRFERQKATADAASMADLDFQIAQLETRVGEIANDLIAELARADERGIELAAASHDLEAQWRAGHRRLRAALEVRIAGLGSAAGVLADRLAMVGTAVDDLLAAGAMG